MDEILLQLLDSLDAVAKDNEEIYDTVCRDRMSDPIFHLFIKPEPGYGMPADFGLCSDDANAEVRAALTRYIDAANHVAGKLGIDRFHQRLSAFQNNDVRSTLAGNFYDDYFGWMKPDDFDENGNVVRRQ